MTVWLMLALACALSAAVQAADEAPSMDSGRSELARYDGRPVVAILFQGNRITREIVLREELVLHEGDRFDAEKALASRQYLKNLGLFKQVSVSVREVPGGVEVTYTVEEKWYLLPIPRLGINSDADVSYGGELRWDNALGLNQQFKLVLEDTRRFNGERVRDRHLEYHIPKIPGTRFGVGVASSGGRIETRKISRDDNGVELGLFEQQSDRFSLSLSRWLKRIGPSHGWSTSVAISAVHAEYEALEGTPELPDESRRVTLGSSLDFTSKDDHELFRTGEEYGAGFGFGRRNLGSDHNYYDFSAYWRRYNHLTKIRRSNLNWQLRLGYNMGDENAYSLVGGGLMRGLQREEVRGDVFALLNLNWLVPLFGHDSFRGVLFTDIGNAWPRGKVDVTRWEYTVGLGFRWKIRSLVRVSLRGDIGYDPATGEYKAYGGTNYLF
ncbi:MAG: hypothetical protein D6717_02880 [Gammaproteobacteria bacterium]|nr:MAG: hypothetical protein D6717_02880 [Gammaproteobacteria bacterium]